MTASDDQATQPPAAQNRKLKVAGIGCVLLLGACIALAGLGAILDFASDADDETIAENETAAISPDTEPTPTAEPSATSEPDPTTTPEPQPTETPEPTSTPEPAPTETPTPRGPPEPSGEMAIYHFDVGQADATLIDSPGANILIDTGHWQSDDVVPYLQSVGVGSIDLMILTHPDADHIGQVPQVMGSFDVAEVWTNGYQHDTQTFERSLDAILDSDAGYAEPTAGHTETIGDVVVEVIHPGGAATSTNDSLGVRITYGGFAALYTGDSETEHESAMLSRGENLSADLLHLGHHGSSTSTTQSFLDAVGPSLAIYSAGADNTYGHPHAEVVERVQNAGVHLYGTDVHGTIVVTTDGESYDLEIEREGNIDVSQPEPEPDPDPQPEEPAPQQPSGNCDPAYPDVCIPSPPPDLNCGDVPHNNIRVLPPDPHGFDGNNDGVGCES